MRFRKLEPWEHGKTKKLYEEVFPEDQGSFADYYYQWKTRDNVIFAAENEEGIQSMVHLNPFRLAVDGRLWNTHYIVAVATRKEYRHRGLMRRLLELAENEMREAGEPFTFLMPASEKIYLPFGYRYFSTQRTGRLSKCRERQDADLTCGAQSGRQAEHFGSEKTGDICCNASDRSMEEKSQQSGRQGEAVCGREEKGSALPLVWREIRPEEYQEAAVAVNRMLSLHYRVYVQRDEAYYRRMRAELAAMGGQILGLYSGGRLIGTVYTAEEEGPEEEGTQVLQNEGPGGAGQKRKEPDMANFQNEMQNCTKKPGGAGQKRKEPDTANFQNELQNHAEKQKDRTGTMELHELTGDPQFMDEVAAGVQLLAAELGKCRVYGCPEEIPLEDEQIRPLMMGKALCGKLPEEPEAIFLNEIV